MKKPPDIWVTMYVSELIYCFVHLEVFTVSKQNLTHRLGNVHRLCILKYHYENELSLEIITIKGTQPYHNQAVLEFSSAAFSPSTRR